MNRKAARPPNPAVATFDLWSKSFSAGGEIPREFTCDGGDLSPHLTWGGGPGEAKSLALIMEDPDAPGGTFTHWILFDIPADVTDLPSGTRSQAIGVSGRNSRGDTGYMGPCPPSGTHRYFFRLYALDVGSLGLLAGVARQSVDKAIALHTIGTAELMARYGR